MRHAILLLSLLVAACGGGGSDDTAARDPTVAGESRPQVQTADLTGLYQASGESEQRSRMCMIAEPSGVTAFGLVVETPNGSCSGAGEARRAGNMLRLTMTGDEQCAIEARIEEKQVTFPASVAQGCAYYCGTGATLAGASFEKTGGTSADAMRATDLAGDPLCG